MIKAMELMREQQATAAQDAALAQRKAMVDAQNNAAELGMRQANTAASQDLARMQEYQKSLDAQSAAQAQEESMGMGSGVTGGGYDINAANQVRYGNLGAAAPMLPPAMGNVIGGTTQNPVMEKRATSNKFSLPEVGGITFGGR
jgi:hypothetical protein